MAEYRGFDILDYIVLIVRKKKLLLLLGFVVAVFTYLTIFFFVEEQYDSTAMIIPSEQKSFGDISSLLGSISDLPFDLGGLESSPSIDRYETLIFSRTFAEEMIQKFDLVKDYKTDTRKKTIEAFQDHVETLETDEGAYNITVRANSPQKSTEMTNYLVSLLNDKIIEMNIQKSRDNRIFLEKRYEEISERLKNAEDSLQMFQERTGILLAEDQIKATIESYAKLETELAMKQIELSVAQRLYGKDNPSLRKAKASVEEFEKELKSIKKGGKIDFLLTKENLSEESIEFLRHFRNVEIYNKMLEFILPLYEQAKFEEQKKIPILQIIDYAVAPEKKSFPPRTLLTLLVVFLIEMIVITYIIIKENIMNTTNDKVIYIRKEAFNFKSKKD